MRLRLKDDIVIAGIAQGDNRGLEGRVSQPERDVDPLAGVCGGKGSGRGRVSGSRACRLRLGTGPSTAFPWIIVLDDKVDYYELF